MERAPQAFIDSVRHDPLMAAEGADLERAREAVQLLRERLEQLPAILGHGSLKRRLFLWRYPLTRYLYPVSFLESFVAAERARREFLADPTHRAAKKLIARWRQAARSYERGVQRSRRFHDRLIALDANIRGKKVFNDMVGNSFTISDVYGVLDALAQNAQTLVAEVESRARLLQGREEEFRPTDDSELPARVGGELTEIGTTMLELNDERHGTESIIIARSGPITVTTAAFDGDKRERIFFVYELESREHGYRYVRVEPADRFYLLPIIGEGAKYGRIGADPFKTAIERGIPFWMQTGTRFYTTRDQRYWADALTAYDLSKRPELDRRLVAYQRSSMLEYLLMTLADEVEIQTLTAKVRNRMNGFGRYSFAASLFAHSNPSMYFMPFNGSVWRLSDMPRFAGSSRTPPEQLVHDDIELHYEKLSRELLREMIFGGMNRVKAWREQGFV